VHPVQGPLGPDDQGRSELPKLPKEQPVGYRPGLQLEERLTGLGVAVLGLVGLIIVYLISTGVLPAGLPPPPQPRGVLVQVPVFSATSCLVPLIAISSVVLVVLGLRRAIDP
jgi:hypothetical protein